eukprot:c18708_g1_i1 orf=211-1086(-)
MQAQKLGVCVGRQHFSLALFHYNNNNPDITLNPSLLHRAAPPPLQLYITHLRPRLQSLKQVSATIQENITESIAGTRLVKVKFMLQRRCEFGQQFHVVGDDELFGAWNPEASIPMQWSEGHIWTTELEVLVGKRIEYKVILLGDEEVLEWQPGPNRVLETMESLSSLVVLETWLGEDQDDAFLEHGLETNELPDIQNPSKLAASEDVSADSVTDLGATELLIPVVDSESDCKNNVTTVDEIPSEQIIQASKEQTMSLVLVDSNTRELSVLEKDLQWIRGAWSSLWGTFVQG